MRTTAISGFSNTRFDDAYAHMVALIEAGVEFPDAQFKASHTFGLSPSEADRLQAVYDEAR